MSKNPQPAEAVEVFLSYAREDAELCVRLHKQLSFLRRSKNVSLWYDSEISPGEEWHAEIKERLDSADLILLLVSADFAASDFCYEIEAGRAMERHNAGEAVVVPIILHPCQWQSAPFAKLQALPEGGKAVSEWSNVTSALDDVARGVSEVVDRILAERAAASPSPGAGEEDDARAFAVADAYVPPPPAIDFVPRKDKEGRDLVERLRRELTQEPRRLLVLWGQGGVGKTTIAAETVRALSGVYGERIVWASAEKRSDFDYPALLNEIAADLGRPDLAQLATGPKEQAVVRLIAEAPALVVLDNFETVAPDDKSACADFLAARAGCHTLVTTRERVAHDGARHVHVESMSDDEARQFVARWIEMEAGEPRMFEGLDHGEIIRAAEARPYVLQWVLAQINLADDPRGVLEELSRAEGEVGERVFARSFNLPQLGDDARNVLLALSLFTPSASRASLAVVSGFMDDERRLNEAVRRLAALRLVSATTGGQRLAVEGLTRSFARSRLAADKRSDELRHRFAAYFARHAEAHARPTPRDFDALDAEKDNLLAAMDTAFGMKKWRLVTQIRSNLDMFFGTRGYYDDAVRSGEQAAAAADELGAEQDAATFRGNVAVIYRMRGEYEKAVEVFNGTIDVFRRSGREENVGVWLHNLGWIAQDMGDFQKALRIHTESLLIRRRIGDLHGIASSLHHLGMVRQSLGDLRRAERLYVRSLRISDRIGDLIGVASSLHQLSRVCDLQGDTAQARHLLNESLKLKRMIGDQAGIAGCLNNLGMLAEKENDLAEAARLFREAVSISERLGLGDTERVRGNLARVEGASG